MWRWSHFVINWILKNLQNRSVRLDFQLASVSRFHVQAQAVQPENNLKGKSGVDKDSDSKDESARLLANSINFFSVHFILRNLLLNKSDQNRISP